MTYTIKKQFAFEASHVLRGMPDGHQCGRMHGHSYRVEVVLQSDQLDERGFVLDFGDLNRLKKYIDETLDHRHLNDVISDNPTAENLARHLYQLCRGWWNEVSMVRVSETVKTWAEYAE